MFVKGFVKFLRLVLKLSYRDNSSSEASETDKLVNPVGDIYNDDVTTPVFAWTKKPFTWQQIVKILSSQYDDEQLCADTPIRIKHNVAFLVQNSAFANKSDIKCDDMGVWHIKGSPKVYFSMTDDNKLEKLESSKMESDLPSTTRTCILKKTFYVNASSPDCRKVISVLLGR